MKLSFGRWTLACLFGCALIAVALLPPERDEDPLWYYRWQSPLRVREADMQLREGLSFNHSRLLAQSYSAALDAQNAKREFGGIRDSAAEPVVRFAPDIPAFARREVMERLASERASRGELHGHGAVGVLVVTDTATTIDGVHVPAYTNDRTSTVVLPPSPENAYHCVAIVRFRHRALSMQGTLTKRPLLDGCAFMDAFGAPGPKIAESLRVSRYARARRLSVTPGDSSAKTRVWLGDQGGVVEMKCRGGDDGACVDFASAIGPQGWYSYYGRWNDLSVNTPDESPDSYRDPLGVDELLLESLERDLGPSRFQRMWKSQKTLAEAYFDETGEPFAGWVRTQLVSTYGSYHIGPLAKTDSLFITAVSIALLFGISLRYAPRPYAT